jgi:hypothetical protein
MIAGSAAAECALAHTPTDDHPDLVVAAAGKVRSVLAEGFASKIKANNHPRHSSSAPGT